MILNEHKILAKPKEFLNEHNRKTLLIAEKLLKEYERTISIFSQKIDDSFFNGKNKAKELKDFIVEMIQYHDYGKANPEYQVFIEDPEKNKGISKENRQHSIYSFFLWFINETSRYDKRIKDDCLKRLVMRTTIAYGVITGHHGKLKNFIHQLSSDEINNINVIIYKRLKKWETVQVSDEEASHSHKLLKKIKTTISHIEMDEYLLNFSKFAYSILTNSDSISSSEIEESNYEELITDIFMRDIKKTSFDKSFDNYDIIQTINRSKIKETDHFTNMKTMNDVRTLVNKKTKQSYDEGTDIYILESPVGSGKTISSLTLAQEIIQKGNKKRIISNFPLNSVQNQYAKTITEDIGLPEDIVNMVNSEIVYGFKNSLGSEEEKQLKEENLWLFKRNSFSNEIIITSHVKFFDVFGAMKRKDSLGLLNLIDSVVIIDEIQNYRKEFWYRIWKELLRFSEVFGTKFIVTTGTLPVSESQLLKNNKRIKKVFTKKENEELFKHPEIKNRCKVEKLTLPETYFLDDLKKEILDDISVKEKEGKNQFIICMTFVEHSKNLYEKIKNEIKGYDVYYLAGRHSSEYKNKIIEKIMKHNKSPEDKIILVTTKTVECGMDFDFDYGYKEYDRFDSVEQLSGRINRSNKKKNCGLKVFEWKRMKLDEEKLFILETNIDDIIEKINNKVFIELYEGVYIKNRISIQDQDVEFEQNHIQCNYEGYGDNIKVIEDKNFVSDMFWSKRNEEHLFINDIDLLPKSKSYAQKVKNSIELKRNLEAYTIKVTNRWLFEMIKDGKVIIKEHKGIEYFIPIDDEYFLKNCLEYFVIDGVESFLESGKYKEMK